MRNEIKEKITNYVNDKMKQKKFEPGKTNIPTSYPNIIGEDMAWVVACTQCPGSRCGRNRLF